jgi:hypothetical protein
MGRVGSVVQEVPRLDSSEETAVLAASRLEVSCRGRGLSRSRGGSDRPAFDKGGGSTKRIFHALEGRRRSGSTVHGLDRDHHGGLPGWGGQAWKEIGRLKLGG